MRTQATHSPSRFLAAALALAAGTVSALSSTALAGGTPEYAIVIIDPTRADALQIGHYYARQRNIPETNIIYAKPGAANYPAFRTGIQVAVQNTLDQRGIADHADYIVIAPPSQYRISAPGLIDDSCFTVSNFSLSGCYSISFISSEIVPGTSNSVPNGYSATIDTPVYFDSNNRYLNGAVSSASNARRYYIGALLGWTGNQGNSVQQIIDMIDRSVAVDGTRPAGTFYYMNNANDGARNVRQPGYATAVTSITSRGGSAQQLNGVLPNGRTNILGCMTGASTLNFGAANITILPGAFGDHLTSYAGTFENTGQTVMTEWISNGASGTAGTVEEPCNYPFKFPAPRLHVWYYQGLSLGEAYFRSMAAVPFQNQFLGDPLTRPFAYIPTVTVANLPSTTTPVSGSITFTPNATTTNPANPTINMDILIDGIQRAAIARNTPYTLDTTTLDDGWHDLRVLGREFTGVRHTGRLVSSFITNNYGRSATLIASATQAGINDAIDFTVSTTGPAVREVRILQNGRVLATGLPGQNIRLYGSNIGPGLSKLRADVVYADNRLCRAAPIEMNIDTLPPGADTVVPIAYSYTKPVPTAGSMYIVELPAAFTGDPANATYTVLSSPANFTISGDGPYRFVTPPANATGSASLTFRVQTTAGFSNTATITLQSTAPVVCTPDFNADGILNADDLGDFITGYFNDPPDTRCDFNFDGVINADDLGDFITAYFNGC